MESPAGLLLTEAVSPPDPLVGMPASLMDADKISASSEARKIQAAKDFESVLITQLLDVMKNTIGDWGLERDASAKQMDGIFWMYLGRDIANNGGFGLWQDLHNSLCDSKQVKTTVESAG